MSSTSSYARLRGRSSGAIRCAVLGVGGDDPAHELVPHHVLLAEADELDPLDAVEDLRDDHQARVLVAREVDLGDVAR